IRGGTPHFVRLLGLGRPVGVSGSRDERIALIAERQRGVVSRGQLFAAGIAEHVIDYMLSTGRLLRLHDGVYAVGHSAPIPLAAETAAVLACGPNTLLCNGHA